MWSRPKAFGRVTRRVEIYRGTNYKGHPRAGPEVRRPRRSDGGADAADGE